MASFDNIFISIINVLLIMTLEGWCETMYFIRKAMDTVYYDVFFIAVIIFGNFFALNLMLAVQYNYLAEVFYDEKQRLITEMKARRELDKQQLSKLFMIYDWIVKKFKKRSKYLHSNKLKSNHQANALFVRKKTKLTKSEKFKV